LDQASSKPKKAKSKIKLHLKKSSKIKNSLNVKKSFENNNRLSTNSNQSNIIILKGIEPKIH